MSADPNECSCRPIASDECINHWDCDRCPGRDEVSVCNIDADPNVCECYPSGYCTDDYHCQGLCHGGGDYCDVVTNTCECYD